MAAAAAFAVDTSSVALHVEPRLELAAAGLGIFWSWLLEATLEQGRCWNSCHGADCVSEHVPACWATGAQTAAF